jgi:hypothetical protein
MRAVYLVVSHRNPSQVVRLARVLREESPGCRVVVRHNKRHSRLSQTDLDPIGGVTLLEDRFEIEWASFAHLEVLLSALRLVQSGVGFDWLTVLSGQDYPVLPVAEAEADLAVNPHDAFAGDAWRLIPRDPAGAGEPDPQGFAREVFLRRHLFRHFEPPLPARVTRALARAGGPLTYALQAPGQSPRLGVRRRSPFGDGLACWVGSDWVDLSARAVRAVLDFADDRPELLRYYRGVFAPTESFLATALFNSAGLDVSSRSRRFVRWPPGGSSPALLGAADVEEVIGAGRPFARKFDATVDAAALDLLDAHRRRAGAGG